MKKYDTLQDLIEGKIIEANTKTFSARFWKTWTELFLFQISDKTDLEWIVDSRIQSKSK
jgi:hypothetical protein